MNSGGVSENAPFETKEVVDVWCESMARTASCIMFGGTPHDEKACLVEELPASPSNAVPAPFSDLRRGTRNVAVRLGPLLIVLRIFLLTRHAVL